MSKSGLTCQRTNEGDHRCNGLNSVVNQSAMLYLSSGIASIPLLRSENGREDASTREEKRRDLTFHNHVCNEK